MPQGRHRVHFSFWLHEGVWTYALTNEGLWRLGPTRKTKDADVIRDLARRGGGLPDLESKHMLEYAIGQGKGALYLHLTDEQYTPLEKQVIR